MANDFILVRLKADFSRMDRIENSIENNVRDAAQNQAQALWEDIQGHWTVPGPSSRGQPPAILTGNLNESGRVYSQGRDVLGRFAGKDAVVFYLRIDTNEGPNPLGRGDYATVLEEKMDREFVGPAIERVSKTTPFFYRKII